MSKDGQDDNNVNNDKMSTQLYSGAHVKNVINKITARINAFNPTEIQQLKSSAASISTEGVDPEIAKELKDLIASITQKEEEEKNSQISNILAENQRISDEAAQLQEWKEEMLRLMETQAVYSRFDAMSPAYLKEQQEYNKNFSEALKSAESGEEISDKLKKKLTKTPEQIEEEKKKWQQIEETRQKAHEEHEHHTSRINEIDQSLTDEDKVIAEKTRMALHHQKQFHVESKKAAEKKLEEVIKHDKEREAAAKNHIKAKGLKNQPKSNKDFFQEQNEQMKAIHGKSPEQIVAEGEKRRQLRGKGTMIDNVKKNTEARVLNPYRSFSPSDVINNSNKKLNKGKGGRW